MGDSIAFEAAAAARRLSSIPLLSVLDAASLAALETQLERVNVPGGQTLFVENEVADALYVVMVGCLGVMVRGSDGHDSLIARIHSGETVGEMALLDGGLRSATVKALRDTQLLRLHKRAYERLVDRHPRSMLSLVSLLVRRLRNTTHHIGGQAPVRAVALVPLGYDSNHHGIARDLANRMADDGQQAVLLDCKSAACTTDWFNAAEAGSDLVLYCAEATDSAWTALCLRQSDRVLLVASPGSSLTPPKWLLGQIDHTRQPVDLVLAHDACQDARQAAGRWRERLSFDLVCHIRRGNSSDVARLIRLLRGKAVSLVLSAGGARGFAHLGVVRALREAHIPIDLIGGCSMGAVVGAAMAQEWDDAELKERLRHAFARSNPINDYTLPFLALTKGQKVARRLEENFGSIRIEDLWRPFFCVSTNLSAGTLAVHRDGPLVPALRASISIPGLLPPVMMAGDAHVDGAVMNWLPVDVMGAKRGPVIAVDVASDRALVPFGESNGRLSVWQFLRQRRKIPPIVDLLVRAGTVSSDSLGRAARERADILFKPPLEAVDLLDWQACDHAIEAGYRHAIEKLELLDKSMLRAPW
ncbi:NTE family protein [Rhizobiales bacterium GAS188]|nr:NTE family protein [Rhizobiales bacterium GAS188]